MDVLAWIRDKAKAVGGAVGGASNVDGPNITDWVKDGLAWLKGTLSETKVKIDLPNITLPDTLEFSPGGGVKVGFNIGPLEIGIAILLLFFLFGRRK